MKTVLKLFLVSIIISFTSCEKGEISSENDIQTNEQREPSKAKGCETAFAFKKGVVCFSDDDDLNSNRWGWSLGPLTAPHSETFEIHQGAGQCNIFNGEFVGTLTVNYELDGTVSVDYNAFDGYGFYETHLFIGNEKYPRKNNGSFTVAPGQYPYGNSIPEGSSSDAFEVDGFEGDIYIIAHAVVCYFDKEECEVDAGLIKPEAPKYCYNEEGDTIISAIPDGDAVVPAGFEILYVLTEGPELTIIDVSDSPSFAVDVVGDFTIHTLVYDPNTLDLNIIVLGVTTGEDVLNFIGENEICAALDGAGASILVEKCDIF